MPTPLQTLITDLQQFDNPKGYRLKYEDVKEKLQPTISRIIEQGADAVPFLHDLLKYEESWSSLFALSILKELKNQSSIHPLIDFIRTNEDSEYWESCEEAMFALTKIGEPAIAPLIQALEELFLDEEFSFYLVGALTEIKNEKVYSYMVSVAENFLANPHKFKDWFYIDSFCMDFDKQENSERALPLLKKILSHSILTHHQMVELKDTIKQIEDPEGYEKETREFLKSIEDNPSQGEGDKLGRNDPCWCGSEKKYKRCCLEKDMEEIGDRRRV